MHATSIPATPPSTHHPVSSRLIEPPQSATFSRLSSLAILTRSYSNGPHASHDDHDNHREDRLHTETAQPCGGHGMKSPLLSEQDWMVEFFLKIPLNVKNWCSFGVMLSITPNEQNLQKCSVFTYLLQSVRRTELVQLMVDLVEDERFVVVGRVVLHNAVHWWRERHDQSANAD